jgi:hypothetical protein
MRVVKPDRSLGCIHPFCRWFYQALGAGRSIENAYKLGWVQIRLYGIEEHLMPVLIQKGK